jgi:hypothetical protein
MQMAARNRSLALKIGLSFGLLFAGAMGMYSGVAAQAPAAAASVNQVGTVKSIAGTTVTLLTDQKQTIAVSVPSDAKVVQTAVDSKDLKTAKPSQFSDIALGDRVLATGKAGDAPGTLTAVRVVVIKSSDIAQMQAAQQADWRARGTGGIVSAVDPAAGTITLTSGAKKIAINTSSKTEFKRFANDSVKYEDAKTATLAQIQVKDQLQARGTKSADGASMQAEEVVFGSFENLSGQIASIDPATGKITLKDLAMKKVVTVDLTANSDIRNLPAQTATRFAQQSTGGGAGGGRGGAGGGRGGAAAGGGGYGGGNGGADARRSAGADLSQMIARLPTAKIADLHKGDAVMIVATEPAPGASVFTAITVLTGVDPILDANPNGGMSLSMSVGGGGGAE